MTVSGSGRTREKDTRAPARGPFCVLGSSLAGEEGVLLQGGLLPFGGSPFRMHAGSPADMRQDERIPISFGASVRPCISPEPASLHAVRQVWRSAARQPVSLCPACLTDRQSLSLFYIRCRCSRSLVLLGSHVGGSRQSIEQDSPVEYLSPSRLSGFFMSAF